MHAHTHTQSPQLPFASIPVGKKLMNINYKHGWKTYMCTEFSGTLIS